MADLKSAVSSSFLQREKETNKTEWMMIILALLITMSCSIQLPGYERELGNGVGEFGMGEGQESETEQLVVKKGHQKNDKNQEVGAIRNVDM